MSVTDDVRAEPRPPSGPPPGGGSHHDGHFDKTPPQDIAAEQCVLGGMLLSKDAIADVVEILKTGDFYRPVHATIFDAVLDLYGRGEPADPITVSAALSDSGDLGRIGGAPYLHTLIASVPTAANASYYARIVSERAVLRRLVEAGTRIVQLGYGSAAGGGRDVDDIVDLAQQAVYDITERRVSEDFAVLADMLQPTLDEIEAVGAHGGMMTGVPTGFSDLDRLLNGLHPGQLIIVAGRPGLGKALALDTPVPTPSGWTTMGAVKAGDLVIGADGEPTTVTRAFDVRHDRPCFEVSFSDGSVITADADHLWKVTLGTGRPGPRHARQALAGSLPARADQLTVDRLTVDRPMPDAATAAPPAVLTTAEVAAALRRSSDGPLDIAVRNSRALALPPRDDLIIAPYTLGAWLGCGDPEAAELPGADPEIAMHLAESGLTVGCLRAAGVYANKHIPVGYLRASQTQRRALLAGILDTDGTVAAGGDVQYRSTSAVLADGVYELVVSLGYHCAVAREAVGGRTAESSTVVTLTFGAADDVFRLERKRLTHQERRPAIDEMRLASRQVTHVRPVPSVPVRCIAVDNADHMYLAGRSMIPTHNSTASMDFARNAAIRHNCASAIFSLEMSKIEIVMRLLSAEARVPLHVLRSGQLSDDDWTKLARRMGEISEAPIFVDDTPSMNLMEIRAKARRLKQRHDLKLIVVDYLQLMTSPKRTESRQQEVADLSRGLKLLAKEVECPVIAVSQLNRGPEQRTDKRPQLSDLRESGCLTAATRVMRADNNTEVTFGDLIASGARDVPVWALNERLQYTPRTLTHAFASGRRQVHRLTLASGKTIEATANHPFLTFDGWVPLARLSVGDRLGAPRHVPPPLAPQAWAEPELIMLAHLIGDGSFVARQPVSYASRDEENLAAVTLAAKHFGVTADRDDHGTARVTTIRLPAPSGLAHGRRNPVADWLDGLGLLGRRPHDKFLPNGVFRLPKGQVALFLRHLWATHGAVTVRSCGGGGRVHFSSTSRRLLDDVSRLLLRFGITARVGTVLSERSRNQYTLDISGRDDQLRFLREIGVHGERSSSCARLIHELEQVTSNTNADNVPKEVWSTVGQILTDRGITAHRATASVGVDLRGSTHSNDAPGRQRLQRIAAVLGAADLELHATNDILWDEIVSIEALGEQDVYDATVMGTHNFIANGIATHNSIEQDADVVILLHRDDYYDKESPRAGEADFIVAKHRNGPTDTVTVAAQLHLSRFVDMAIV